MDPARRRAGRCVLTLHRIVERDEKDHDLCWRSFLRLAPVIAAAGGAADPRLDSDEALRRGGVVLTLDDGTADHARVAEELAGRGMSAVFFVPACLVGRPGYLSPSEVRRLIALGHRVGSHALADRPLDDRVPADTVRRELRDSKERLEDWTGAAVTYFAPPGGVARPWMMRELAAHGYTASRSMRWGVYASLRDRWMIPCLPVTELTLARGWVARALATRRLPPAMRSGWAVKRLMPGPVRESVRAMLHARLRPRR